MNITHDRTEISRFSHTALQLFMITTKVCLSHFEKLLLILVLAEDETWEILDRFFGGDNSISKILGANWDYAFIDLPMLKLLF